MGGLSRRNSRTNGSSTSAVRLGRIIPIGIIGAGRVGAVLGAAFRQAGHQIIAASGVSSASRARAARLLPDAALLPPDQVPAGADLVLLAVPDDALAGLVRGLVEAGALRPGQVLAH